MAQVIADAVAGDPVTYNEGFLGKDNAEYCRWGAVQRLMFAVLSQRTSNLFDSGV